MPREVIEGVWLLDLGTVNAYLVAADVPVLVDAGLPWQGRRLRAEIERAGFDPAAVERVFLTHYDLDHVGALAALPGPLEIYAGEPDATFVSGARRPGFGNRKRAIQHVASLVVRPPDSPVIRVADVDEIGSFTAFHAPGHTAGHVVYANEERDVAFLGDLVRSDGDSLAPLPWFLNDDGTTLADSIERVATELPALEVAAPGHGEPLRGGVAQALRGGVARALQRG